MRNVFFKILLVILGFVTVQAAPTAAQKKIIVLNKGKGTTNYSYDFGTLGIGQLGWVILEISVNQPIQLGNLILSGSSEYKITQDGCSGKMLLGGSCEYKLEFVGTSAGVKNVSVTVLGIWQSDGSSQLFNVSGTANAMEYVIPPSDPADGDCKTGSFIRVDDQSMSESIPIFGTPFSLTYTSSFTSQYISTYTNIGTQPKFHDLGWSISGINFYDIANERLFLGSGGSAVKAKLLQPDGTYLVLGDGEVFIFDSTGKQIATKGSLTGFTKYSFIYNSNRISSITDAYGNLTNFERDSSGHLIKITTSSGLVTHLEYSADKLVKVILPNGDFYRMSYVASTELLKTFVKPNGNTTYLSYDEAGKLIQDTNDAGNITNLNMNFNYGLQGISLSTALNRETQYEMVRYPDNTYRRVKTNPDGSYEQTDISDNNSKTVETDLVRTETTYGPDIRFGSLAAIPTFESKDFGDTILNTSITQSAVGLIDPFNFTSVTTAKTTNGETLTSTFNKVQKKFIETSPAGIVTSVLINEDEKPKQIQVGTLDPIEYDYFSSGEIKSVTQGASSLSFNYDQYGYLSSVRNSRNETFTFINNLLGKVVKRISPDSRVTEFRYDKNGNITQIVTPSGISHLLEYSPNDTLISYKAPLVGGREEQTRFTYNSDNQLVELKRPDLQYVRNYYDAQTGKINEKRFSNLGVNRYYYDPDYYVLTKIDSYDGITNAFSYWGTKLASLTWTNTASQALYGSVNFTYDSHYRVASRSIAGAAGSGSPSVINYTYNGDGKVLQAGELSLGYDSFTGKLKTTQLAKVSDQRTYDSQGRIVTYSSIYTPTSGPVQTIFSYTLTRDSEGRILTKSETSLGVTTLYSYEYDSSARLTKVWKNSSLYSSYNYDLNGNRVSGYTASVPFVSIFDKQDKLVSYNQNKYFYNSNGDLSKVQMSETQSKSFRWDPLSGLRQAILADGRVLTYAHDGNHDRVRVAVNGSTSARYIYESPLKIAAQVSDQGIYGKRYMYASGTVAPDYIKSSGVNYFIVKDHLGSVRFVVNSSDGSIAQKIEYSDLGKVLVDSNKGFQAYGFAGGIYDQFTQLVKFGKREYDGETGTWLSKDPILFGGRDTNLYGYVLQDPINFTDPDGESSDAWESGELGYLIGVNLYNTYCANTKKCEQIPIDDPWTPGKAAQDLGKWTAENYLLDNSKTPGKGNTSQNSCNPKLNCCPPPENPLDKIGTTPILDMSKK
ncbi:RHS repeat domain-containing protein [Bdellovibrio sp. NC01]|uniref:RHS repeat domain-containing protein n=1 Tax=Bdellovibrio sp. NC01 TaxID=2220073 RepID=UPI00115995C8|nr:RHS repeat-associated core domain-containing protein [Bdellovibrio sp. NC01]QDK37926.1 hypothetical protein DOE51_10185 [Bdellovibrio sp. NC01]